MLSKLKLMVSALKRLREGMRKSELSEIQAYDKVRTIWHQAEGIYNEAMLERGKEVTKVLHFNDAKRKLNRAIGKIETMRNDCPYSGFYDRLGDLGTYLQRIDVELSYLTPLEEPRPDTDSSITYRSCDVAHVERNLETIESWLTRCLSVFEDEDFKKVDRLSLIMTKETIQNSLAILKGEKL